MTGVPKPDARTYVILQPFGPVLFVYDLSDIEPRSVGAEELPEKVTDPFAVEGELSEATWTRTLQNCREKKRAAVCRSQNLHRRHGGRVELRPFHSGPKNSDDCLYRILLNENLEMEAQYEALAYELGHLFCGHLGTYEAA